MELTAFLAGTQRYCVAHHKITSLNTSFLQTLDLIGIQPTERLAEGWYFDVPFAKEISFQYYCGSLGFPPVKEPTPSHP